MKECFSKTEQYLCEMICYHKHCKKCGEVILDDKSKDFRENALCNKCKTEEKPRSEN